MIPRSNTCGTAAATTLAAPPNAASPPMSGPAGPPRTACPVAGLGAGEAAGAGVMIARLEVKSTPKLCGGAERVGFNALAAPGIAGIGLVVADVRETILSRATVSDTVPDAVRLPARTSAAWMTFSA